MRGPIEMKGLSLERKAWPSGAAHITGSKGKEFRKISAGDICDRSSENLGTF